MKWFQDIFTKSKLMVASGILALLCWLAQFITAVFITKFGGYYAYALLAAFMVGFIICY